MKKEAIKSLAFIELFNNFEYNAVIAENYLLFNLLIPDDLMILQQLLLIDIYPFEKTFSTDYTINVTTSKDTFLVVMRYVGLLNSLKTLMNFLQYLKNNEVAQSLIDAINKLPNIEKVSNDLKNFLAKAEKKRLILPDGLYYSVESQHVRIAVSIEVVKLQTYGSFRKSFDIRIKLVLYAEYNNRIGLIQEIRFRLPSSEIRKLKSRLEAFYTALK